MAAFQKFNSLVEHMAEGVHNFQTHAIKAMLVNSPAPVAGNSVKADLTEIAAGNGYTAGGITLTVSSSAQTGGVYRPIITDATIVAAGGSIGPFRYAVVYNDTPTSPADPLISFYDYGASITLLDGESLLLDFDPTNGLFGLT